MSETKEDRDLVSIKEERKKKRSKKIKIKVKKHSSRKSSNLVKEVVKTLFKKNLMVRPAEVEELITGSKDLDNYLSIVKAKSKKDKFEKGNKEQLNALLTCEMKRSEDLEFIQMQFKTLISFAMENIGKLTGEEKERIRVS